MGVSGHRSASPIVHGSRILVGSGTIIGGSSSPTVAIGILSLLGWKKRRRYYVSGAFCVCGGISLLAYRQKPAAHEPSARHR